MFLLAATSIMAGRVVHQGLSGDVYWQWAAGKMMLAQHQILRRDPFSYTLFHRPWVADEWGYEVLLAESIAWLGPSALWVFSAGFGALALALAWMRLKDHADDAIKPGLVLILMALSLAPFVKDRPQTLSYVLFVGTLWLLQQSRQIRWPRFLLIPLLWFWVQCHGSFPLGFALVISDFGLGLTRPQLLMARRARYDGAVVLALAGLSSWINPYGWRIWTYVIHVSTSPAIAKTISEWQSPNFHNNLLKLAVWLPLLLLGLVLIFRRDRLEGLSYDLIWTFVLLLATLESVRFLPYFALEWGVVVMAGSRGWRFVQVRTEILAAALLGISLFLWFGRPIVSPGRAARSEPVAETTYLKRLGTRAHVFNYYVWGGYLDWRGIPVFIDGRTDFYLQHNIFKQYVAVQYLTVDPGTVFRRFRVKYVLWPPSTPLATYLLADPHWRLIYQTKGSYLFQHIGRPG